MFFSKFFQRFFLENWSCIFPQKTVAKNIFAHSHALPRTSGCFQMHLLRSNKKMIIYAQRQLYVVAGWRRTSLLAFSWHECEHLIASWGIEDTVYLIGRAVRWVQKWFVKVILKKFVFVNVKFWRIKKYVWEWIKPFDTRSNSNARRSYGAKPITSRTVSRTNLFFFVLTPRLRLWRSAWGFLVTLWPLLGPTTRSWTTAILNAEFLKITKYKIKRTWSIDFWYFRSVL